MSTLAAVGTFAPVAFIPTLACRASLGVSARHLCDLLRVILDVVAVAAVCLRVGVLLLQPLQFSRTRAGVVPSLIAVPAVDCSVVVSHDFLALLKKVNVYLITLTVYHRHKGLSIAKL